MTKITYIPGEIANAAIDEHGNRKPVTRTHYIFDDAKGKSQAKINADVDDALALHQSEINALDSQNYATVDTFGELPATGALDTVYRVANYDGTQVVTNKYAEYAWNGTQYKLLDVKEYGIDDEPSAGSDNFVKSNGVNKTINDINKENYTVERTPTIYQQKEYYTTQGLSVGDVFPETYVSTAGQSEIMFANCHTTVNKGDFICISGKNVTSSSALYCLINKTTKVILAIFNGQLDNEIIEVLQDDCQIWFCHKVTGSTVPYNLEILSKNDDTLKEITDTNTDDITELYNTLGRTIDVNLKNITGYKWLKELGVLNAGDKVHVSVPSSYTGTLQVNGNSSVDEHYYRTYIILNSSVTDYYFEIVDDNTYIVLYPVASVSVDIIFNCNTKLLSEVEKLQDDVLTTLSVPAYITNLKQYIIDNAAKGIVTFSLLPGHTYNSIGSIIANYGHKVIINGNGASVYSVDVNNQNVLAANSNTDIELNNITLYNMYGLIGGSVKINNVKLQFNTGTSIANTTGRYTNEDSAIGFKANTIVEVHDLDIESTVREYFGISFSGYCKNTILENVYIISDIRYNINYFNGLKDSIIRNINIPNGGTVGIIFRGNKEYSYENNIIENCNIANISEESISFDCFGNELSKVPVKCKCTITDTAELTDDVKRLYVTAIEYMNTQGATREYSITEDVVDNFLVFDYDENDQTGLYRNDYKILGAGSELVDDVEKQYIDIRYKGTLPSTFQTCWVTLGFHNNRIRNNYIKQSAGVSISLWGVCFDNIISDNKYSEGTAINVVSFAAISGYINVPCKRNIIKSNIGKRIKAYCYTYGGVLPLIQSIRNSIYGNIVDEIVTEEQVSLINELNN